MPCISRTFGGGAGTHSPYLFYNRNPETNCGNVPTPRSFNYTRINLGAEDFLKKHAREEFGISAISITEFLEGFESVDDGEKFLRPFQWLSVNATVAREASRIRRQLRLNGNLIGDFDILIAATSLVGNVSLVTRDAAHFQRIEGLLVETY